MHKSSFHLKIVALAYVMQKTPYVFPIVGARKVEHLLSNLEGLSVSLSEKQVAYLESVVPFTHGFPYMVCVSLQSDLDFRDHCQTDK